MTPAEANLHRIAESFCAPRVVREVCPTCDGAGLVATSSWQKPEMHVESCGTRAGTGFVSREVAP